MRSSVSLAEPDRGVEKGERGREVFFIAHTPLQSGGRLAPYRRRVRVIWRTVSPSR